MNNKSKSALSGVPWHVETIKKSEDDNRRHKNWCVYFKNGKCIYNSNECYGSKECEFYKYNVDYKKNDITNKEKYNSINYYDYKNLQGKFTLEYPDGTREQYTLKEDVSPEAPIVEKVMNCKIGSTFEQNGEVIKLVMRKIRYNTEAYELQNQFLKNIINKTETDIKDINRTEYSSLEFKLNFINRNKIVYLRAGKSIRWDDPLTKIIANMKSGTRFNYKNDEILLMSKYGKTKESV